MKIRQISSRNPRGLQIGDIVKPVKGRLSSNGYMLSSHPKLKVVRNNGHYWGDRFEMIQCETLDRRASYAVYADAFELCEIEEEYSIY